MLAQYFSPLCTLVDLALRKYDGDLCAEAFDPGQGSFFVHLASEAKVAQCLYPRVNNFS